MKQLTAFVLSIAVLISVHAFAQTSQRGASAKPKGERRLGMSVQAAADGDYGKAFAIAKSGGMQSVTLSLDWSGIEPAQGDHVDTWLDTADQYYPATNTTVDLILRPINTNRIEVPADLRGHRFDSPEVIARFEQELDHVFALTTRVRLGSLAIGNEVDASLGESPQLWSQYDAFYQAVSNYARARRPGLKVGVVTTYSGLSGPSSAFIRSLNLNSDVILVTYYPLNPDFTVKSPSTVYADFNRLAGLYPGRRIILTEAGYPSSPVCGSSEAKQAMFVHNVFAAWDAHSSQISCITFSWLTDLAPASVANLTKYYGVGGDTFPEFLRTLGLRTYPEDGGDKLGFIVWKREARARGW